MQCTSKASSLLDAYSPSFAKGGGVSAALLFPSTMDASRAIPQTSPTHKITAKLTVPIIICSNDKSCRYHDQEPVDRLPGKKICIPLAQTC
jgi:hypothetical protein